MDISSIIPNLTCLIVNAKTNFSQKTALLSSNARTNVQEMAGAKVVSHANATQVMLMMIVQYHWKVVEILTVQRETREGCVSRYPKVKGSVNAMQDATANTASTIKTLALQKRMPYSL